MKGVKELKRRIKSVQSIKKITRAMEMVAGTKLRRLQERALATRPFAERIESMMRQVAARSPENVSPLLAVPEVCEREALVIVGADKGLCGAYNSNLMRFALKALQDARADGVEPNLYIFGRRPQGFFGKLKGVTIKWIHPDPVEKIDYGAVRRTMESLVKSFLAGEVGRVRVVYTRLKTMTTFQPTTQNLLPITPLDPGSESTPNEVDFILEPSPEILMKSLLPRYLEMQLYAAVLESLASEFAARRIAMKSATDAAQDMLGTLGMAYNKARQEGITGELLDIVGGMVVQEG
ncbi:MAG TPA: ATP synthase F1 subunit gamma [Planctomycetota bacterium]|jgi:F-type H+-transporting ATPase subunit gamma|nr:ATP synthase F1 subunit gamma [Planctomycetota bacterium]